MKGMNDLYNINDVVETANNLIKRFGTRNPHEIAESLDITILKRTFKNQLGVFTIVLHNKFIFIKDDLDPVMENIVLLHELGHAMLHAKLTNQVAFQEFNLFNMNLNRLEYEANVFASQIALPDDEIVDYIKQGYDVQQVASAMGSDINLVALKVDILNRQGHEFVMQERKNDFLRWDR